MKKLSLFLMLAVKLTLLISPSCNSHNFASRFQCLKCSTAKPYNPQGHAGTYTPSAPAMKRKLRKIK
jgi:hypothetical protein